MCPLLLRGIDQLGNLRRDKARQHAGDVTSTRRIAAAAVQLLAPVIYVFEASAGGIKD